MSISARRLARSRASQGVSVVASAGAAVTTDGLAGITLAAPDHWAAGDLAVMMLGSSAEFTPVVPAGWTLLPLHLEQTYSGGPATATLFRRLDGTEAWPLTITSTVAAGAGWAANLTIVRSCSGPPVLLSSGATTASPSVTTGRDISTLAGGYTLSVVATTGSAAPAAAQAMTIHGSHASGSAIRLTIAGRTKPDRTVAPSAIMLAANPTSGHRATYWFAPVLPDSGPITAVSGQVIRGLRISRTTVGPAITIPAGVTNVTIEDCEIGPCSLATDDLTNLGIYIQAGAGGGSGITIKNNVIHGVSSGVYADHAQHPMVIDGNIFFDIRGPFYRGQAVQLDGCAGGSGQTLIQNNTSDWMMRTMTTHYEDHFNIYMTNSVSSTLPILVRWNRIRGGDSGSGSGIVIGDTGGDTQYATQNVIVWAANVGTGIAGGTGNQSTHNWMDQAPPLGRFKTQTGWQVQSLNGVTTYNSLVANNRIASRGWRGDGSGNGTGAVTWSGYYDGSGSGNVTPDQTLQDSTIVSQDIWETVTDLTEL